jgi:hypothetical protein
MMINTFLSRQVGNLEYVAGAAVLADTTVLRERASATESRDETVERFLQVPVHCNQKLLVFGLDVRSRDAHETIMKNSVSKA